MPTARRRTARRTVKRPPSRAENDAVIDRQLEKAPWLVDGLYQLVIDRRKDLYHLSVVLSQLPPEQMTPAITERIAEVRRELRESDIDLGLTPAARKGLGMSPTSASAQNQPPGITYRRSRNPGAVLKRLVALGAIQPVIRKLEDELAAEQPHKRKEAR